jgi:hypothetical protein
METDFSASLVWMAGAVKMASACGVQIEAVVGEDLTIGLFGVHTVGNDVETHLIAILVDLQAISMRGGE